MALDGHVEDLGDYLGPAVQEVQPAIFDGYASCPLLGQRLAHKIELAAIIQFPGDAIDREEACLLYTSPSPRD